MYQTILKFFSCYKCGNLPRSPKICSNKSCFAIFCKYCEVDVLKENLLCPNCFTIFKEEKQREWIHSNLMQMFHLVRKLKLDQKCKNFIHGCEFKQPLIEKLDPATNYTLIQTHHLLRNHELECRQCPDCKIKCKDCQQYLDKLEYETHFEAC